MDYQCGGMLSSSSLPLPLRLMSTSTSTITTMKTITANTNEIMQTNVKSTKNANNNNNESSKKSMTSCSREIAGVAAHLRPRCSLFMTAIAVVVLLAVVFIKPATSQHLPQLNTPPILRVPERNWRIYETEKVGQKITSIDADDQEDGELVFGLEPHFHANYANPHGDDDVGSSSDKLPFRIDPVTGDVYLNESLAGRGGENFFLYITVSDGQLTAKNEVFVNILPAKSDRNRGGSQSRPTPSISSVVRNISQFLPAFGDLPGVHSIRNQQPSYRPTQHLPPGFGRPPQQQRPAYPSVLNFNPSGQQPPLPNWVNDGNRGGSLETNDNNIDNAQEQHNDADRQRQREREQVISTTSRTRLTAIQDDKASVNANTKENADEDDLSGLKGMKGKNPLVRPSLGSNRIDDTAIATAVTAGMGSGASHIGGIISQTDSTSTRLNATATTAAYSFGATLIPVIITVCGLFVAAAAIVGFLYRKRLCAISKTLKKKSKEEMAKKSNQSNLSSNLTDDSRNSMVLQHWHGPMAYGNRYVPWERDQQLLQHPMATSQLSTSALNGDVCATGALGLNAGGVGGAGAGNGSGGVNGVGNAGGGNGNGNGGGVGVGVGNQCKYDRWEFPRHRLKFFNILGEGAFGQVWRCEATDIDGMEGVTTVAVKTLKENAAEIEKKDLVSELEVMKSLEPHVNVVRLLGCCTDKEPYFVIIEYVNRGKLQTYLRNSRAERHYGNTHGKSNILTSGDLTSFMYQVAKGMDYLTSRGIIHRDLAARNILISDDHTCKVADFGFARDVITSKIYERKSEGKLPIRWMAIESLYDNIFSVKSDIWSFGILMWEIVTLGSTPYPGISAADVMRKVRDGYRLEKPEHCRRELYNIMYYCWSQDPNERPTFSELVHMLDKLLHTEMDYIELERFPDHNYYNIVNLSGEKL